MADEEIFEDSEEEIEEIHGTPQDDPIHGTPQTDPGHGTPQIEEKE
jgi:hypothetical protein